MLAIGAFQPHQRAQRLGIVIEPAVTVQRIAQRILAGVAERRMADIVCKAQRLGQVLVEPQRARDYPPDLRDFEAVGQPNPVVVAIGGDEHLGLVAQAAEGDRMDDPVAVTLERRARASSQRGFERKFAAARVRRVGGVGGNHASPRIQSTAASAWIRVQS